MALPLWEECSWVKAITSDSQRKFLHETEKEDRAQKDKEIAAALHRKESEDAEHRRRLLEKNEKLLKLTSALFETPAPKPPGPSEPTDGTNPENPTDEKQSEESQQQQPPDEATMVRRASTKKSLFDDDEEDAAEKLFPSKTRERKDAKPSETTEKDDKLKEEGTDTVVPPTEGEPSLTLEKSPSDAKEKPVEKEIVKEEEPKDPLFPFPVNDELNQMIYLYLGAGYKLPCGAIVVGQNESLSDRTDENGSLITLAGPRVEEELALSAPIQTGESVTTTGGSLPCDWIIHAVGPRYDERYLTASEHALFSAYKASLLLAMEKNVKDLVICCVYSKKKKYPRFDAAHIALRTIRKFLQHESIKHSFNRIMFCMPSQEDYEIYSALLTAYFPRNENELIDSLNLLPSDLGDDWGEKLVRDRVLKVSAGPKPLTVESRQEYQSQQPTRTRSKDSMENNSNNVSEGNSNRNSYDGSEDPSSSGQASLKKKTGDRVIVPVGEKPKSISQITHDDDEARRARVAREFAKLSREDRLKLRYQALVSIFYVCVSSNSLFLIVF
jgi:O-acetyl-ADP-ribose deacetylase (regulator of RNase III)